MKDDNHSTKDDMTNSSDIRQMYTIDMPYINDDIPYMYEDNPYMYEDNPYMHNNKPVMYE